MKIPSELIGIIFGDGSVCSHYYEIKVSLGKVDCDYVPRILELFSILSVKPKVEVKKTNEIWVRVWNKNLWTKLLEFFHPGKKRIKKIPIDWRDFLRGLFDTDGSIHFDKGKYPVISIRNSDENTLKVMQRKLKTANIKSYVYGPEITEFGGRVFKLRVYGIKNRSLWIKKIGSNNPRKLKIMSSIGVTR